MLAALLGQQPIDDTRDGLIVSAHAARRGGHARAGRSASVAQMQAH
jgi:hypothetical protein